MDAYSSREKVAKVVVKSLKFIEVKKSHVPFAPKHVESIILTVLEHNICSI